MKYSDPRLKNKHRGRVIHDGIYRVARRLPICGWYYPSYKRNKLGGAYRYELLETVFYVYIEELSEIDEIFNDNGKLMIVESTNVGDEIVSLKRLKQLIIKEGFLDAPVDVSSHKHGAWPQGHEICAHIRARLNNC